MILIEKAPFENNRGKIKSDYEEQSPHSVDQHNNEMTLVSISIEDYP